jgi:hypothetical protein
MLKLSFSQFGFDALISEVEAQNIAILELYFKLELIKGCKVLEKYYLKAVQVPG